jgi:chloramphenicol-sensitive protein RarD
MMIAVTWLGEKLTPDKVIAFACIWVAVAIFIADAVAQARGKRKPNAQGRPSLGVAVPLTR